MRILVLGHSGSEGATLPDPTRSWPIRLGTALEPVFGPVEVVSRSYYPNGRPALAYLERCLGEVDADVIVAQPGVFALTVNDVAYAIRDRFGKRAFHLFEAIEARSRAVAESSGRAGETVQIGARRVARRLIGRAPLLGEGIATETWLATLDRLAQQESVATFLMAPFNQVNEYVALYPGSQAIAARFTSNLRARAELRHFGWIDPGPALDAVPGGRSACCLPDMVHRNDLGHDVTLAVVAGRLVHDLRG